MEGFFSLLVSDLVVLLYCSQGGCSTAMEIVVV